MRNRRTQALIAWSRTREAAFRRVKEPKMARGRKPGFQMTDEHRVKIQNSNILNALIEHVQGAREMSATQVSAGLGLLRKVMPDLAASENKTEVLHRYVARLPEKAKNTETWQQQHGPQPNTIQ